jgi:inosine-uridine nucleoside N-ribohydrolase
VLALAAQQRFESTKIQVVGITTVCGTYGAENATQNITRLLKTMKNDKVRDSFVSFYFGFLLSVIYISWLSQIPVYTGMDSFMVGKPPVKKDPSESSFEIVGDSDIEKEHAVNAIIRLAEVHKGSLSPSLPLLTLLQQNQ